jgi:hypothetical protein
LHGSGTGWTGQVGSGRIQNGSDLAQIFLNFFLPAPVLDPSVLTGHGFDGLNHGSGRIGSRPRIRRVRSDLSGFFYNSKQHYTHRKHAKCFLDGSQVPGLWRSLRRTRNQTPKQPQNFTYKTCFTSAFHFFSCPFLFSPPVTKFLPRSLTLGSF